MTDQVKKHLLIAHEEILKARYNLPVGDSLYDECEALAEKIEAMIMGK